MLDEVSGNFPSFYRVNISLSAFCRDPSNIRFRLGLAHHADKFWDLHGIESIREFFLGKRNTQKRNKKREDKVALSFKLSSRHGREQG